ncbi:MAG: winged helix-turn-helix transcriptional regulator [Candidatus Zambryskibacteria bacterium]|nr:winged helix-turn-helix transcriptional regulator [Candidatus Zambryskibacteria bacterium]
MAEETTTEPVANESVAEPAPVQPEPVVITPPASESTAEPAVVEETPTPQPAEPLNPEPILEPPLTPEPVQEPAIETPPITHSPEPESVSQPESSATSAPVTVPEPQVIASAFSISRAHELLIKAREAIQFRKRKKLEKIMSMFLKQSSITNDEVEKLLHISDATATRYLDQLEREGKIKKGNAGKYLSYSRM